MAWAPIISAGIGIGTKLLSRQKRPNNRRAIAELRGARPTGYLTPEDHRSAELTKGRLAEGAQSEGRLAGYEVSRRARARGLGGSPSEERDQARVGQQVALGVQHAGDSAEEQLYNTQRGREAFQQSSELAIFGANTGEAAREAARQDAQHAEFWNSLNEFMPTILGALGGNGLPNASLGALASGGSGYTPPQPRWSPQPRGYNPAL